MRSGCGALGRAGFAGVCLAVMVLAVGLPAFAQSGGGALYVPLLQASSAADLGLALSNPTLSQATVTFTARTYDGALISGNSITNPVSLPLPASGQLARVAFEIFGEGIRERTGWVEIQTSDPSVSGFFTLFNSSLTYIDGAELTPSGTSSLVFPNVSIEAGNQTDITFVHTGSSNSEIGVSLYDNAGNLVGQRTLALPGRSGFSGPVTNLVSGIGAFEGYVVVETQNSLFSVQTETLIGFESYRNNADIALISGIPRSSAMRTSYIPHLAHGDGYRSRLTIVNHTAADQMVRVSAQGLEVGGQALSPGSVTVDRTVPAFGRFESDVAQLFGLTASGLIVGYIRLETLGSTPGVIATLDYGTTDGLLLSAVPASSVAASDLFFSHVAEGAGYYTGIALLNPGTQTSLVSIDVFTSTGVRTAAVVLSMAPGERRSRVLRQLVPALGDQVGGYIRINATRPIFAFELFGSEGSLSILANVPARGDLLQPRATGGMVTVQGGGMVISANGSLSVAVPPQAVQNDVTLFVTSVEPSVLPERTARTVVSALQALPAGLEFRIPVKLAFPLSVQLPPGTVLTVLILNSGGGAWEDSGFQAVVDESGRNATASVTHFSTYGVDVPESQLITVTEISPSSGVPGTTVTITGSGFDPVAANNIVTFSAGANSSVQATVLGGGANSLTVVVPNGAVTGPVIVSVGVNSSIGVTFTVPLDSPVPFISSIAPTGAFAGASSANVDIFGTDFQTNSTVKYDGAAVSSSFVDNTHLAISLSSAQLAVGVHGIVVNNPSPGGGDSNAVEFSVAYPPPVILSISPQTAVAGPGATTTVTIVGTGFRVESTVQVNGAPVATTFVNSTTLQITLDSSSAAIFTIVVSNPSPGGGLSNSAVLTVLPAPNLAPVVSAGSDQTVVLPAAANLLGTASDDGKPDGSVVTVSWSKVSGPGTVVFSAPTSLATTATFSMGGVYVLRLTATDGLASSTSDVTITAADNAPPAISITSPTAAQLLRGNVNVLVNAADNIVVANVQYRVDGNLIGSSAIAPFTFAWNTATVSDGARSLTAVASDGVNQTTSAAINVTVDNTGPSGSITAPANNAFVRGTVNITATAADAVSGLASLQFKLDGNNLGAAIGPGGPFTFSWDTTGESEGAHALTADVTDVAGNVTTFSAGVTVDNTSPTGVAVTTPANNASIRGNAFAVTATATDATAGIANVQLQVDGADLGAPVAGTGPNFNFTLDTTAQTDGAHTLRVIATDNSGNTTTSATVNVTVDNTSPAGVAITAPAGNASVRGSTVALTATATDATSGMSNVQFLLDGSNLGAPVAGAGPNFNFVWDTTAVTDGAHTLGMIATDNAGNTTAASGVSVSVDNTAPTGVSVTAPSGGAVISGSTTLTGAATDNIGVVNVDFRIDGATVNSDATAPYSFNWDSATVTDGPHTVTIVAFDAAGNETTSAGVAINVVNGVAVTAPTANQILRGNITLTAVATAPGGIASLDFTVDGVTVGAGALVAANTYQFTWATGQPEDGARAVRAMATPNAGPVITSGPVNVTVDNTAPNGVAVTSPANTALVRQTITITATAADANSGVANVQFLLDSGNLGAPVAVPSSPGVYSFSWNTSGVSEAGARAVAVVATDNAGNTTTSPIVNVTVDNTAPAVSIVSPTTTAQLIQTVTANATDANGVASVQFRVNGVNEGAPDTTNLFSTDWDTRNLNNASYVLSAVATDNAGNTTTSGDVTVTVNQYFVSPTGLSTNTGRFNSPWNLKSALCAGPNSNRCIGGTAAPVVGAGATIFMRGGTYQHLTNTLPVVNAQEPEGVWTSKLQGTQASPIIVRSYPGEWAILDGNVEAITSFPLARNFTILNVYGQDTWFMDFEITNSFAPAGFELGMQAPGGRAYLSAMQGGIPDLSDPLPACIFPFNFQCDQSGRGDRRGNAMDIYGPRTKAINLVVHDAGQGIGLWDQAIDGETYGNIVYNNGYSGTDRLHGHGMYTQNGSSGTNTKQVRDSVWFGNFGNGINARGSGMSSVQDYLFEGNVFFNERIEFGGPPVTDVTFRNNYVYTVTENTALDIGETNFGNSGITIEDNTVVNLRTGGAQAVAMRFFENVTFRRNKIHGEQHIYLDLPATTPPLSGFLFDSNQYFRLKSGNNRDFNVPLILDTTDGLADRQVSFTTWQGIGSTWDPGPQSTYRDSPGGGAPGEPTTNEVIVRPNVYDSNRAHITIFNWENLTSVSVDVTGLGLANGQDYELRNALDYKNDVIQGTYDGSGTIVVPMTGRTLAAPIGIVLGPPPASYPRFGSFVLIEK